MRKITLLIIIGCLQTVFSQNYIREWATYFGDGGLWIAGSTEFRGNLYLAGKVKNSTFTGTVINPDSYQYASGGGEWDGFIAKFSPAGQLVWFFYYGGTGDDEITDIAADANAVYVVGKTNSSGMATIEAHQTSLNGATDGFIASFDEYGNRNWHTYYGGESDDEIISVAEHNNSIFLYGRTLSKTNITTPGSFQETITENAENNESYINNFIAEFSKTGYRIWATYYGIAEIGNVLELGYTPITGIAVNETGLYVSGWDQGKPQQTNVTYFGTPGTFLEVRPTLATGLGMSLFLSKFSFDGSRLWSTYLSAYNSAGDITSITPFGGVGSNNGSFRAVTATSNGVYLSGRTIGINGISTVGSFQSTKTGGSVNFVVHFSDSGDRLWGSYIGNFLNADSGGGFAGTQTNGLSHDSSGNIYISGATNGISDIATNNGFQIEKNAYIDCYVAKISSDGTTKIYGTYYGADNNDSDGYTVPSGNGDSFYLIGTSASQNDMTTEGAWQENFVTTDVDGMIKKNIFIAKFTLEDEGGVNVEDIIKNNVKVYPNPNNGKFSVSLSEPYQNGDITLIDLQGRTVHSQKITDIDTSVAVTNLPVGVYILRVSKENQVLYTQKIIVKN
jgi:hypothetical protein